MDILQIQKLYNNSLYNNPQCPLQSTLVTSAYQIQLLLVFVVIGCHEIFFFVLGFLNNKPPSDEII